MPSDTTCTDLSEQPDKQLTFFTVLNVNDILNVSARPRQSIKKLP